jgi:hypothetical protein
VNFQLVLQFQAMGPPEFDELVSLEEELIRGLSAIAEVDGHDFGAGEFNIFVLTDQPRVSFDAAQALIRQWQPRCELKAAYREMDKDEFVILWPPGLAEFTVA